MYKNIFNRVLSRFSKGQLVLTDDTGKKWVFGSQTQNMPDAEITVTDVLFYKKLCLSGDIGLGEAYEQGYWHTPNIAAVIRWFILNQEHAVVLSGSAKQFLRLPINIAYGVNRLRHMMRSSSSENAAKNISYHYDFGNRFFESFLDSSMTYSSGLFRSNETLEEAQKQKYKRICELIRLKSGDHLLEIGCGWGGFAEYAVQNYDCRLTGITLSREQHAYAVERSQKKKIAGNTSFIIQDYRKASGSYDKIVSIEMIEAVGYKYMDIFFRKCHELLATNGIMAIQAITFPDSRYHRMRKGVDWIQKYIFPGGELPSVKSIMDSLARVSDICMTELKDMAKDYAETNRLWIENFNAPSNPLLKELSEGFIRRWNYYLHYCMAAFETRNISVCQMQFARPNNPYI